MMKYSMEGAGRMLLLFSFKFVSKKSIIFLFFKKHDLTADSETKSIDVAHSSTNCKVRGSILGSANSAYG